MLGALVPALLYVACNKVGSDPVDDRRFRQADHSGGTAPTLVTLIYDLKDWTLASPSSQSHVPRSKFWEYCQSDSHGFSSCVFWLVRADIYGRVSRSSCNCFIMPSNLNGISVWDEFRWYKASAVAGRARLILSGSLCDHMCSVRLLLQCCLQQEGWAHLSTVHGHGSANLSSLCARRFQRQVHVLEFLMSSDPLQSRSRANTDDLSEIWAVDFC